VNWNPTNAFRNGDWWDFTDWGFGNTAFSTNLDVQCVCVGNGWQRQIKLEAKFDETYSSQSVKNHEQDHINIAERIINDAKPEFEALEHVTFPTYDKCVASIGEASDLLNKVIKRMAGPQNNVEPWYQQFLRWLFGLGE
jgi:hypothetical protein